MVCCHSTNYLTINTRSWIFWNKLTMGSYRYKTKSSQSQTSKPLRCSGWNILKLSLAHFPRLFYRIDINLFWENWLTEKIIICCFISRSFFSGIMKCYISGTIYKFWNSNCYICGNMRKNATFWNSNCYIWGNIWKIATFYWKCCISWEIYKFSTFRINYAKLKLFYQLSQSQFIVANILVSLDCLNLLKIFNFLDILKKHCGDNIFSNFKMC